MHNTDSVANVSLLDIICAIHTLFKLFGKKKKERDRSKTKTRVLLAVLAVKGSPLPSGC